MVICNAQGARAIQMRRCILPPLHPRGKAKKITPVSTALFRAAPQVIDALLCTSLLSRAQTSTSASLLPPQPTLSSHPSLTPVLRGEPFPQSHLRSRRLVPGQAPSRHPASHTDRHIAHYLRTQTQAGPSASLRNPRTAFTLHIQQLALPRHLLFVLAPLLHLIRNAVTHFPTPPPFGINLHPRTAS